MGLSEEEEEAGALRMLEWGHPFVCGVWGRGCVLLSTGLEGVPGGAGSPSSPSQTHTAYGQLWGYHSGGENRAVISTGWQRRVGGRAGQRQRCPGLVVGGPYGA